MAEIDTFVNDAKSKGLSDAQIRKALVAQGWDSAIADAAVAGLEVPKAAKTAPSSSSSGHKRPSLSPLMAALHHVLLWFFAGSSTVTIIGVVASLSGYEVSSQALAAMMAVTLVTFIPYGILFLLFLMRSRRQPGLIPGKVWSIITICLYSVSAMIAAITLIVTIIVDGEFSVSLSAGLILILDLLIVLAYCFAAFARESVHLLRKIVIFAYLPILVVMFGGLSIMSLIQLAPVRHDEQLRKDLASTVQQINTYTATNDKLPENGNDVLINPDSSYKQKDETTYEVCGFFQVANRSKENRTSQTPVYTRTDDHVTESSFDTAISGKNCFVFTSLSMREYLNEIRQR